MTPPPPVVRSATEWLAARARWQPLEVVFWIAAFAAIYLLPTYHLILTEIAWLGLFALSLDLILGYAGIISLGHAAFFGFGAYTAALLAKHEIIGGIEEEVHAFFHIFGALHGDLELFLGGDQVGPLEQLADRLADAAEGLGEFGIGLDLVFHLGHNTQGQQLLFDPFTFEIRLLERFSGQFIMFSGADFFSFFGVFKKFEFSFFQFFDTFFKQSLGFADLHVSFDPPFFA